MKDITDYCVYLKAKSEHIGGKLTELFNTAERYEMKELDLPETKSGKQRVIKEYQNRTGLAYLRRAERTRKFQSTDFLDAYIELQDALIEQIRRDIKRAGAPKVKVDGDLVAQAKAVPMTEFLKFTRDGFAPCPFHNEKSASFHHIAKSNKGHCFGCNKTADVIEVVAAQNNLKYMEAVKKILNK